MIRNFKALGLALIAVLALSAVGASWAQAQLKMTTTGPTWLTFIGTSTFKAGAVDLYCTSLGGHSTVVNNQSEVTVTNITYSGCTGSLTGFIATIAMNGCDYLFHGGETDPNNSEHGIEGEVNLVCPEGQKPTIDVYQNASKHTEGVWICKLKISPITNDREITYINTAGSPNDFDLKMIELSTPYVREGGLLCGVPLMGKAKTSAEITVKGFKDEDTNADGTPKEGERTGVTIS